MSKRTDTIAQLFDQCNLEEKHEVFQLLGSLLPKHKLEMDWNTSAEAILTAIARSTDLTQRGIRGILAEATFEKFVIPLMKSIGWQPHVIVGDQPYDFALGKGTQEVRIQVKLQRKESGRPMLYSKRARAALKYPNEDLLYVVETQRTRTGKKKGNNTRPYRFGEFDILAVNLHPSTGDWQSFIYTVGNWLIPRSSEKSLIEIFQPVPIAADAYWTNDLEQCIDWLRLAEDRTLYFKG